MIQGIIRQCIIITIMIQCILCSDIDIAIQIYNQLGGKLESGKVPGVNLDANGNVIEILWSSKGLKGPIPAAIGELKNLKYL